MGGPAQTNPTEQRRDPLGDAIRAIARDKGLRLGALAGVLLTGLAWLAALGLSWLPGAFTAAALGVVPDKSANITVGPRLAASLLAPWLTSEHIHTSQADGFVRSVSLIGVGVVVVLLLVIGAGVRAAAPTLRSRAIALLVAAVGSAAGLSIAAAFVSYRIDASGETATVTYSGSSLFWVPLLWIVGVGLFTFGVVGRLHAPLRVALRTGGALVGLVAVTAAVAFPVVVVSWSPINQTGKVQWSTDLAEGLWHWGGGFASVAVPLAFGTTSHLSIGLDASTPFNASVDSPSTTSGDNLRLPELAKYMDKHANARLTGYAGTGGTAAHILLLVGAGFILLLFVFSAVRGTRVLGAPRALDGLRHGLLIGFASFLFVLALKWIGTAVIGAHANGVGYVYRWGLDAGPLFQTGGELLGLCGLSGLLYAALRPTAYRYELWRPRLATAYAGIWPGEERLAAQATEREHPETSATTLVREERVTSPAHRYCSQCGHALRDGDVFCAQCGERT